MNKLNKAKENRNSMGTYIIIGIIVVAFIVFSRMGAKGVNPVNAETAKQMIEEEKVAVLDVRSSSEFANGHIKGAKLIPVNELAGRLREIDSLKNKPLIVNCHSGTRSASACGILVKNGFTGVRNLQGGISAWIGKGYTVVR